MELYLAVNDRMHASSEGRTSSFHEERNVEALLMALDLVVISFEVVLVEEYKVGDKSDTRDFLRFELNEFVVTVLQRTSSSTVSSRITSVQILDFRQTYEVDHLEKKEPQALLSMIDTISPNGQVATRKNPFVELNIESSENKFQLDCVFERFRYIHNLYATSKLRAYFIPRVDEVAVPAPVKVEAPSPPKLTRKAAALPAELLRKKSIESAFGSPENTKPRRSSSVRARAVHTKEIAFSVKLPEIDIFVHTTDASAEVEARLLGTHLQNGVAHNTFELSIEGAETYFLEPQTSASSDEEQEKSSDNDAGSRKRSTLMQNERLNVGISIPQILIDFNGEGPIQEALSAASTESEDIIGFELDIRDLSVMARFSSVAQAAAVDMTALSLVKRVKEKLADNKADVTCSDAATTHESEVVNSSIPTPLPTTTDTVTSVYDPSTGHRTNKLLELCGKTSIIVSSSEPLMGEVNIKQAALYWDHELFVALTESSVLDITTVLEEMEKMRSHTKVSLSSPSNWFSSMATKDHAGKPTTDTASGQEEKRAAASLAINPYQLELLSRILDNNFASLPPPATCNFSNADEMKVTDMAFDLGDLALDLLDPLDSSIDKTNCEQPSSGTTIARICLERFQVAMDGFASLRSQVRASSSNGALWKVDYDEGEPPDDVSNDLKSEVRTLCGSIFSSLADGVSKQGIDMVVDRRAPSPDIAIPPKDIRIHLDICELLPEIVEFGQRLRYFASIESELSEKIERTETSLDVSITTGIVYYLAAECDPNHTDEYGIEDEISRRLYLNDAKLKMIASGCIVGRYHSDDPENSKTQVYGRNMSVKVSSEWPPDPAALVAQPPASPQSDSTGSPTKNDVSGGSLESQTRYERTVCDDFTIDIELVTAEDAEATMAITLTHFHAVICTVDLFLFTQAKTVLGTDDDVSDGNAKKEETEETGSSEEGEAEADSKPVESQQRSLAPPEIEFREDSISMVQLLLEDTSITLLRQSGPHLSPIARLYTFRAMCKVTYEVGERVDGVVPTLTEVAVEFPDESLNEPNADDGVSIWGFNTALGSWEPIVEPWMFDLKGSLIRDETGEVTANLDFTGKEGHPLNVNMSPAMIDSFCLTAKAYDGAMHSARPPYVSPSNVISSDCYLVNDTGAPITYWVTHDIGNASRGFTYASRRKPKRELLSNRAKVALELLTSISPSLRAEQTVSFCWDDNEWHPLTDIPIRNTGKYIYGVRPRRSGGESEQDSNKKENAESPDAIIPPRGRVDTLSSALQDETYCSISMTGSSWSRLFRIPSILDSPEDTTKTATPAAALKAISSLPLKPGSGNKNVVLSLLDFQSRTATLNVSFDSKETRERNAGHFMIINGGDVRRAVSAAEPNGSCALASAVSNIAAKKGAGDDKKLLATPPRSTSEFTEDYQWSGKFSLHDVSETALKRGCAEFPLYRIINSCARETIWFKQIFDGVNKDASAFQRGVMQSVAPGESVCFGTPNREISVWYAPKDGTTSSDYHSSILLDQPGESQQVEIPSKAALPKAPSRVYVRWHLQGMTKTMVAQDVPLNRKERAGKQTRELVAAHGETERSTTPGFTSEVVAHFRLPHFGVSLMTSTPDELLLFSGQDVDIAYANINNDHDQCEVKIGCFQLDNQLSDAISCCDRSDLEERQWVCWIPRRSITLSPDKQKSVEVRTAHGTEPLSGDEGENGDKHDTKSGSRAPVIRPHFFHLSILRLSYDDNMDYIKYFSAMMQPARIQIDEAFLLALASFVTDCSATLRGIIHPNGGGLPSSDKRFKSNSERRIYIETLQLHPVKIQLSVTILNHYGETEESATGLASLVKLPLAVTKALLSSTFSQIDSATLYLNALHLNHAFASGAFLMSTVQQHYMLQGMRQIYSLIGAADILGNPVGLVTNLGVGVKDFFYEPAAGLVTSPQEFVLGLSRGTTSLFTHSLYGAFNAASKVTGTLSEGIATLSLDRKYLAERRAQGPRKQVATHIGTGLIHGTKQLGKGIFAGVTGVITAPAQGAIHGGLPGFIEGVGKGLIGVAVKPAAGVLDLAATTAAGITATTSALDRRTGLGKEVYRRREPRLLRVTSDQRVRVYTPADALVSRLLLTLPMKYKLQLPNELYDTHIFLPGARILVATSLRLLLLEFASEGTLATLTTAIMSSTSIPPPQVLWSHPLSKLVGAQRTPTGIAVHLGSSAFDAELMGPDAAEKANEDVATSMLSDLEELGTSGTDRVQAFLTDLVVRHQRATATSYGTE
ncbi:Vacuolar protein sorting-associated protein 13, C-terminal [Phytophthora cactorum]|nr:Vacuolar protein sorting-associated protein 13, C-terminal [Phytophthora cactorum]